MPFVEGEREDGGQPKGDATDGLASQERPRRLSEPLLLTEPAEGLPQVVSRRQELQRAAEALSAGEGPVAIDTERASSYRYSSRAYLLQLRRAGTGTVLVDPVALDSEVEPIAEAINDTEWVLHAATQDLPCLDELGLRPAALFDTELAGRLAGFDRVALGSLLEELLGYSLEKGHGAADWSIRPLPQDWLNYAALDVELLLPLRARLSEELDAQGKLEWAEQEFEAIRTAKTTQPRAEPWRRTSGVHKARTPRQLARVRSLWMARDNLARQRDLAPGRVLPDSAITNVATASPPPRNKGELIRLPVFGGRAQRKVAHVWMRALHEAESLSQDQLPSVSARSEGPPPASRWADRDPVAAARLNAARGALTELAQRVGLQVENLLLPELVRRLCWEPPDDRTPNGLRRALHAGGARPWQIELTADLLSTALHDPRECRP